MTPVLFAFSLMMLVIGVLGLMSSARRTGGYQPRESVRPAKPLAGPMVPPPTPPPGPGLGVRPWR
jgi:hypothetical protein